MSNFRDKLKQSGYDAEDAYFYKLEQELIHKMREKNAREQLKLIQGNGAREETKLLPRGQVTKKAA